MTPHPHEQDRGATDYRLHVMGLRNLDILKKKLYFFTVTDKRDVIRLQIHLVKMGIIILK